MRKRTTLVVVLLLPMVGLVLLLVRPSLDVEWEHYPSHFWLVLGVALLNVLLGLATSEAARRRSDVRLFLVSMALFISAGFLGLHALATPEMLVGGANLGFVIATPVGLLLASGFAAVSAVDYGERGVAVLLRWQRAIRLVIGIVFIGWALASLGGLSPLAGPHSEEAPIGIKLLAPLGIALYAFAALRYGDLSNRRRKTLPLAVAVAFLLLAEAMVAVAFSWSWHASWWEWHVLMAMAFATIALAARREYRREGTFAAAFGSLYLSETLDRIDRRFAEALKSLVSTLMEDAAVSPVLDDLRAEGFDGEELAVLERSARELWRVDQLFREYVDPHLAARLAEDPELARLGGHEVDGSVLFADLVSFTTFSEKASPVEVVDMLNGYWGATVPVLAEREGALIERFAGDAVLAVFNALEDQPDHPIRAARAGLSMQLVAERVRSSHPTWPRFRVGINTGPVVVGNVGARSRRSFSAIGDTTNVAARIQSAAPPGHVLVGATTYQRIAQAARVRPIGPMSLRGRHDPIDVYELVSLDH